MKSNSFFLILFVVLAATVTGIAQPTYRGNFLLGTRVGFSAATSTLNVTSTDFNYSGRGSYNSQWSVSPIMGYFLANNFAFGIGMEYITSHSWRPEDSANPGGALDENYDSDLLFGPIARVYFPTSEDNALFLSASYGFGNTIDQIEIGGNSQNLRTQLSSLGIGAGFTIFNSRGLSLEALVKYNYARSRNTFDIQDVQRTTISQTNAVDLSVGLHFYIGQGSNGG